jgi:dGTPase
MLKWNLLLNDNRRKRSDRSRKVSGKAVDNQETRTEIERDHDRVLFSTPVRRLGDKTQVFPLERNDSVRNRLTHSHEVSNLARSIGVNLVFNEGIADEIKNNKRNVPAMLGAIGLAHDLGNPPFGHQGEAAIQKWFQDNPKVLAGLSPAERQDFLKFEGNAQTLRLATKLQLINDNYGLDLTYGTLAALMKYTVPSNVTNPESKKAGFKKHGFFQSETPIVKDIWKHTGLKQGQRHPLTYIMEACDDIAYSVLDAEDAVKKGLASFSDLMAFLKHATEDKDRFTKKVCSDSEKKNLQYRLAELTPAELNDVSMQRFRVFAIGAMVHAVSDSFLKHEKELMRGTFEGDLLSSGTANQFCKALKRFDKLHAYKNRAVLEVELTGYNVIQELMNYIWPSINETGAEKIDSPRKHPLHNYIVSRISENYKRVATDPTNKMSRRYRELQLMTDMVSGMTDSFAIDFCKDLRKHV